MAETDTVRESITVVPVKYSMSASLGEEKKCSKAIFSTMSRKVKQANKYTSLGIKGTAQKFFRIKGT